MGDAVIKQWTETLELFSRARETGELLVQYARRALASGAGKASVMRDVNVLRESILALDGRCEDCAKARGEETEVGRDIFRLCEECFTEREIERESSRADAAYDAWKDGER